MPARDAAAAGAGDRGHAAARRARRSAALLDLRARGCDLAVVEVSPDAVRRAGRERVGRARPAALALQREALRARYERLGVAVVSWRDGVALDAVLEGVAAFRRYARHVRV